MAKKKDPLLARRLAAVAQVIAPTMKEGGPWADATARVRSEFPSAQLTSAGARGIVKYCIDQYAPTKTKDGEERPNKSHSPALYAKLVALHATGVGSRGRQATNPEEALTLADQYSAEIDF